MGGRTDKIEESRAKEETMNQGGIEGDIKRLRQEVNFLERKFKGEIDLKTKRNLKVLNEKYVVKK